MNTNGLALVPCRDRGWKMGLDNIASLALYRRLGFGCTGEEYPVYKRDI